MAGSTFGTHFKITTWGESHGKGIGVVVDGRRTPSEGSRYTDISGQKKAGTVPVFHTAAGK